MLHKSFESCKCARISSALILDNKATDVTVLRRFLLRRKERKRRRDSAQRNRVLALSGVLKAVFAVVLEDAVALEGGIVAKNDRSSRQQYENIISSDENKKDSLMQKKADGRMKKKKEKYLYS